MRLLDEQREDFKSWHKVIFKSLFFVLFVKMLKISPIDLLIDGFLEEDIFMFDILMLS